MFTLVRLVKKRLPDLSQEEFTRYWIDGHPPLTTSTPGMRACRRYPMVSHDGDQPAFDAISFASFDHEAAWRMTEQSPEFPAAIAGPVTFQDIDKTQEFYESEFVIRWTLEGLGNEPGDRLERIDHPALVEGG